ncbi:type II secretory pathway pseudopilin PulG [Natronocella acetinitrilica]|uniref:Type II secretory pathway pseudopilin PulG n=1 Tax=Natronocella acetinitrilica TaxID=414046 RepID=A0AAE3G635_9GAMM|nr:hypothetical protein [Natronocella acetinitrilica]MCP1674562.1 type II secretory pathway pseudopilin PulG [Natronocella acetinitrilica]
MVQPKSCSIPRCERGAALLVSLMLLAVLSLIVTTAASRAIHQERMAGQFRFQIEAAMAADAALLEAAWRLHGIGAAGLDGEVCGALIDGPIGNGATHARARYLATTLAGNAAALSACLDATDPSFAGADSAAREVAREAVAVRIRQAADACNGASRCYLLLAEGRVHAGRSSEGDLLARALAELVVSAEDAAPSLASAVTCFGMSGGACSVYVGGSPDSVDGRDYHLPDAFDCRGSGCRTAVREGGAHAPGVQIVGEGGVYGEGESGGGGGDGCVAGHHVTGCPQAVSHIDGAAAEALFGDYQAFWGDLQGAMGEAVYRDSALRTGDFGTRDNPQFTVLGDGATINGNASGAGVLVVGPGVRFSGTMSFEGIVLVLPWASLSTGNSTIYGSVIGLGGEVDTSVTVEGNGELRYSVEAIERALEAFGVDRADTPFADPATPEGSGSGLTPVFWSGNGG